MKQLLSTKRLNTSQEEKLKASGWNLTQYDAISIDLLPVHSDPENRLAIFSSKYAVEACLSGPSPVDLSGARCLCVGNKTSILLKQHGIEVLEVSDSAAELAERIKIKYSNESFVYYCGNRRLETLPIALEKLNADWEGVKVYNTSLVQRNFSQPFHGILFFSPSGVESFMGANSLNNSTAFCIGETTAATVRKFTNRIIIAPHPALDAVVEMAAGHINPVKF